MEKSKKTFKKVLIIGIVIIAIVIIASFIVEKLAKKDLIAHEKKGDWEIVSTQSYSRDNKKCMGYRIYVKADYGSKKIYKDIFRHVTNDDGYYLHTVWIYNVKSMADGSNTASYILEQTQQYQVPEPKIP